jgi:transcriptional regulator with XRE-family HTH domain
VKFHEVLKSIRIEKGFTQKSLADKLGVSETAVRNWENTAREPSYEILCKLAKIFDITVGQLLGAEEI